MITSKEFHFLRSICHATACIKWTETAETEPAYMEIASAMTRYAISRMVAAQGRKVRQGSKSHVVASCNRLIKLIKEKAATSASDKEVAQACVNDAIELLQLLVEDPTRFHIKE